MLRRLMHVINAFHIAALSNFGILYLHFVQLHHAALPRDTNSRMYLDWLHQALREEGSPGTPYTYTYVKEAGICADKCVDSGQGKLTCHICFKQYIRR